MRRFLPLPLLLALAAGCVQAPIAPGASVPRDLGNDCADHCAVMGMRLAAVVLVANSGGCVCEPAGAMGAPRAAGGAAAAAGGAIIVAQEQAQQAQQAQLNQQSTPRR